MKHPLILCNTLKWSEKTKVQTNRTSGGETANPFYTWRFTVHTLMLTNNKDTPSSNFIYWRLGNTKGKRRVSFPKATCYHCICDGPFKVMSVASRRWCSKGNQSGMHRFWASASNINWEGKGDARHLLERVAFCANRDGSAKWTVGHS